MHGLINRAIQCFVVDSYGTDTWVEATRIANLGFVEFESMLVYDDDVTPQMLNAVSFVLNRDRNEVMEDIGTYLVSNPNVEALRRLLRFGGLEFVEFLHSLDDLPDRARLAVSDLNLPALELHDCASGQFSLVCQSPIEGYGHVMTTACWRCWSIPVPGMEPKPFRSHWSKPNLPRDARLNWERVPYDRTGTTD